MLRLAPGAIAIGRRLWLEAGMANSPSSDAQQSGGDRQATVLVVDDDPALQTMIFDYFVDNNIQTLPASGRKEMVRQPVRSKPWPADAVGIWILTAAARRLAECARCGL